MCQVAEGYHFLTRFADDPVKDVQVVARFGQNQRRTRFRITPASAYVRMAHVHMLHRLEMLDADQLADCLAVDHLFQHPEVRRVTQYMGKTYDLSFFFGISNQTATFLVGLCNRFFEQDVVSQVERFHARGIMKVIGGGDNYGIGKLGTAEHLFPGGDTVFLGYMVFVAVYVAAQFHQLRNTCDLQVVRMFQ